MMSIYKNIDFDDSLSPVVRHLATVHEYRETLQALQGTWDNLTLLGQLSGSGTDMNATREAFATLTADLLNHLGVEIRNKAVQALKSKAQVAVDIMVRNLFERTADIGFLAMDEDVLDFARCICNLLARGEDPETCSTHRQRLEARFNEYVRKYSVYHDIVLFGTDGRILARLDPDGVRGFSTDPLVQDAQTTCNSYVEVFRTTDLFPGAAPSLIYAYRVDDHDGKTLAVLALCFNLENETHRIFANLGHERDWTVLTLLDAEGTVVASSDRYHLPLGATLERVLDADWGIVRFAGREYLAITRPAQAYQGYTGPGWMGHAMIPLEHAFEDHGTGRLSSMPAEITTAVMKSPTLFSAALRNIPCQAEQIQRELNRSVWNGNVRQSKDKGNVGNAFSKVLLWEIGNTGLKTTDVFARSIGNLNETVVSSILDDSAFLASLAIDIMDRNLYERANDCRWWALTTLFSEQLELHPKDPASASTAITAVLEAINALYTVYDNLVVFDANGVVIASSNTRYSHCIGRPLAEEWVRRCLNLEDSQGYVVSAFEPTALYQDRHTYLYAAAIPGVGQQRPIGGIAVVFDAAPQFAAMLHDALPRNSAGDLHPGSLAVFADRQRKVISSTSDRFPIGSTLPLPDALFGIPNGHHGADIVLIDGQYFAVGVSLSAGYREYKSTADAYRNEVAALVFVPLGSTAPAATATQSSIPARAIRLPRRNSDTTTCASTEIATFHIGDECLGIVANQVIEAVDANGITSVPGLPDHVHGVFMYKNRPVLVLDLKDHLRLRSPVEASSYRQVIVVQGRNGEPFGILVHQLGDIPEVANDHIDPVSQLYQSNTALAESVVRLESEAGQAIFIVLSPDRIMSRLLGNRTLASEHDVPARVLREIAQA
ncbi:chemotaxis protein CheW [Parazoarcus communis]|nr:chemotaxis protein CheW [Parazoarcus communis]